MIRPAYGAAKAIIRARRHRMEYNHSQTEAHGLLGDRGASMAIHKVDLVIPANTPEKRPLEIEVGNIKRIAHLGIRLPSENDVGLQFSVMDTPVYPSQGWLHTFQWHIIHLEEPIGFDVPYRLRIRAVNPSPKESLCIAVLGEIDETADRFHSTMAEPVTLYSAGDQSHVLFLVS